MELTGKWPYIAGAGLLLLLIILARSGGSAGGSATLVPVPTGSAGDDAVRLQHEQNSGALLGALVSGATQLTGQIEGYRGAVAVTNAQYAGEATLQNINAQAQQAIAGIAAGRDVEINRATTAAQVEVNRQNTDSSNTVAKANARASSNNGFWSAVGNIAGAALKFLF